MRPCSKSSATTCKSVICTATVLDVAVAVNSVTPARRERAHQRPISISFKSIRNLKVDGVTPRQATNSRSCPYWRWVGDAAVAGRVSEGARLKLRRIEVHSMVKPLVPADVRIQIDPAIVVQQLRSQVIDFGHIVEQVEGRMQRRDPF